MCCLSGDDEFPKYFGKAWFNSMHVNIDVEAAVCAALKKVPN